MGLQWHWQVHMLDIECFTYLNRALELGHQESTGETWNVRYCQMVDETNISYYWLFLPEKSGSEAISRYIDFVMFALLLHSFQSFLTWHHFLNVKKPKVNTQPDHHFCNQQRRAAERGIKRPSVEVLFELIRFLKGTTNKTQMWISMRIWWSLHWHDPCTT